MISEEERGPEEDEETEQERASEQGDQSSEQDEQGHEPLIREHKRVVYLLLSSRPRAEGCQDVIGRLLDVKY